MAQPVRDIRLDQVRTLPAESKRWALLVGVDRYDDSHIGSLAGAAHDARAIADALVSYCGFPRDQVIVLATGEPAERQPTRVNILRRLSNLQSIVPRDGLFLFSFSGHGIERGGKAFLIPADAQLSNDVEFMQETALSLDSVAGRIRSLKTSQAVLLIDACRNEPGGRANSDNPLSKQFVDSLRFEVRNRDVQAFAVIYAASVGQRAYEYAEKKQGYFSWALIQGLSGGAANARGDVTLSTLLSFIQSTVPKRIAVDLGNGLQQRPYAVIEGYRAEDLILATPAARPGAVSDLTPVPAGVARPPVAPEPPAREPRKHPVDGQTYVWIPPGTFQMGCSPGDATCAGDEMPRHPVTITSGFWLGQTEVTQSAFQKVMNRNPSHFQGANLPVESVLHQEAADYCGKVGGRLPTEAEWEYAARAGSEKERYGDLTGISWYGGNSGGRTHEAGQKTPNAWNLHDTLGNVWEWTADWYAEGAYRDSEQADPRGPGSGTAFVLRGGGWNDPFSKGFRVSLRNKEDPANRFVNIGFRCIAASF